MVWDCAATAEAAAAPEEEEEMQATTVTALLPHQRCSCHNKWLVGFTYMPHHARLSPK
jgi:hypothetical protein